MTSAPVLQSIAIRVHDLPAMCRFYAGVLGATFSEVEIAQFLDENDTHPLIKDRVLETDEDPYTEGKKTLKLKPSGVSQGTVRQDMGRGRSKAVVVETRKRRLHKPSEETSSTPAATLTTTRRSWPPRGA